MSWSKGQTSRDTYFVKSAYASVGENRRQTPPTLGPGLPPVGLHGRYIHPRTIPHFQLQDLPPSQHEYGAPLRCGMENLSGQHAQGTSPVQNEPQAPAGPQESNQLEEIDVARAIAQAADAEAQDHEQDKHLMDNRKAPVPSHSAIEEAERETDDVLRAVYSGSSELGNSFKATKDSRGWINPAQQQEAMLETLEHEKNLAMQADESMAPSNETARDLNSMSNSNSKQEHQYAAVEPCGAIEVEASEMNSTQLQADQKKRKRKHSRQRSNDQATARGSTPGTLGNTYNVADSDEDEDTIRVSLVRKPGPEAIRGILRKATLSDGGEDTVRESSASQAGTDRRGTSRGSSRRVRFQLDECPTRQHGTAQTIAQAEHLESSSPAPNSNVTVEQSLGSYQNASQAASADPDIPEASQSEQESSSTRPRRKRRSNSRMFPPY